MRMTDYLVAASAIVNAARTGTHEITGIGLAHLDELLALAADDALEIERLVEIERLAAGQGLQQETFAEFVAKARVLHAQADMSVLLPPDDPPQAPQRGNVVAFPAHIVKRWPLLSQQPEARELLMAIAKSGEIGPRDGGDAA